MKKRIVESYKTASEEETYNLGIEISKTLKPGDTICLTGDLGSGKTAMAKGIASGLGINETITSPTFTIVNSYEADILLHHFDVYRIDDPEELYEIGWDEYFGQDSVCIVEWGDKFPCVLPPGTIKITISRSAQSLTYREITVEREV